MRLGHKFQLAVLTTAAFSLIFLIGFIQPSEPLSTEPPIEDGFAVVELFTSQGCSSCPPADRLLNRILDNANLEKSPVYGLSFHVDYWNYLGWKDPYSREAWSKRQRAYAQTTGDRRVYTPQMVVNGIEGFVGSNATAAETAIRKAIETRPTVNIQLSPTLDRELQTVNVSYSLSGDFKGQLLNIALVEDNIENYVKRGENATRTLSHSHVVRAMTTMSIESAKGSAKVSFPADVKLQDAQIIAFVQQVENFHITGANHSLLSAL